MSTGPTGGLTSRLRLHRAAGPIQDAIQGPEGPIQGIQASDSSDSSVSSDSSDSLVSSDCLDDDGLALDDGPVGPVGPDNDVDVDDDGRGDDDDRDDDDASADNDASAGIGALIGYRYKTCSTGTSLHRTTNIGTHGYRITGSNALNDDDQNTVTYTLGSNPIPVLQALLGEPSGYCEPARRRHTSRPPKYLMKFISDYDWHQLGKDSQHEWRNRYHAWENSLSLAEKRVATATIDTTTAAIVVPTAAAATVAATVTAATAVPAAATAATVAVPANPVSRVETWDHRFDYYKQKYHAAGLCANLQMSPDEEAKMIRACLQNLGLCPLDGFGPLGWNSNLLPRLFKVLAWSHQPAAAQLFKAPPAFRSFLPEYRHTQLHNMLQRLKPRNRRTVTAEDLKKAVRLVELHLFHLTWDAIEFRASSNGQQGSRPGPDLLGQARAMLQADVMAMEKNNCDQIDATFLEGNRLYSRGGLPVVADPASEYTGHSLKFVKATLKRAGPVLGLDGRRPLSATDDPQILSVAHELEKMIVDKPRGVMLRQLPARLHREFAHTFELILHCYEQVHTSWTNERDKQALSNRTHAMFIAMLYFPTLVLTTDIKSAETPMSQIKINLEHFLRGDWYAPVHTYMSMAERSSTTHARQDEPAMRLGNQGTDLMKQAAKMVPAAQKLIQGGEPAKGMSRMTSQGKFEGKDGESTKKQFDGLHPNQESDVNGKLGDLADADDAFTGDLVPWVANPSYGPTARANTRAYFERHIDIQKISLSIKKARSRTSPGIGGGTFDMLKILVYEQDRRKKQSTASVDTILQRLHYLALSLLSADLPAGCDVSLRRNILLGLKKKDSDVPRPIGIGDLLRRFTGRLASEVIKEPLRQLVGLWQQGSSTPSGSDVVASVARCFHQLRPSKMISVRTDVKNAFNSGDRRWIIRVLETYFPEFGPLVRALYEGPTDLVYTDPSQTVHHVEGQKGVTQGCPLASHLFNLAARHR